MPSLRQILPAILLLSGTAVAFARSPEEVATDAITAIQEEGPQALARFTHPDDLKEFRGIMEPLIAQALAHKQSREAYRTFADPYDLKKVRPFTDDQQFMEVFIRWLVSIQSPVNGLFKDLKVQALGAVPEGELRHVVLRLHRIDAPEGDTGSIMVMELKMDGGIPMLELMPELRGVMMAAAHRK